VSASSNTIIDKEQIIIITNIQKIITIILWLRMLIQKTSLGITSATTAGWWLDVGEVIEER